MRRVIIVVTAILILMTDIVGCASAPVIDDIPSTTSSTTATSLTTTAPSTTSSATTTTTTQKPTTTTKVTEHTNSQAEIDAATKLLEDNVTDEERAAMESRKNAPCRYCGQQRDERHHCYTRDKNCPDCGEFVKRLECHFCG